MDPYAGILDAAESLGLALGLLVRCRTCQRPENRCWCHLPACGECGRPFLTHTLDGHPYDGAIPPVTPTPLGPQ